MNNFFATLFTATKQTGLKVLTGIGTGILTLASAAQLVPGLPIQFRIVSGIIVALGTVLGVHAWHVATPPKTPDQIG